MDPVTLIVTALAAGAAALQDGAPAAVKDAYARLAGRPDGELVLARQEAAPQAWRAPLTAELSEAGAGDDAGLAAAAQALLDLLGAAGARAGRYAVLVSGSQGVQAGDHDTQASTFGAGPA